MFLKAGALSLALLLASRLLGLVRESAQAAAFGASAMGDVAVLMLTLPDWLTGVLANGALAYVLLPQWAGQAPAQQAQTQGRVARFLLLLGLLTGGALCIFRDSAVHFLASGLPPHMIGPAEQGLVWAATALPAALLAALWVTRLQHEQDFAGLYAANLVVNGVLIVGLYLVSRNPPVVGTVSLLGLSLWLAMGLRLVWLRGRLTAGAADRQGPTDAANTALTPSPHASLWLWAALAAGLPLVLPFVARSFASSAGEGALATFNYAWKLVELPLVLAIQLVATLAFPAIVRAMAARSGEAHAPAALPTDAIRTVRSAFLLAWTLACAAVAALQVGAPALVAFLFGWGRMSPDALARVAAWGSIGAWSLLPQALIAVALTVLAAQGRMRWAVAAYAVAIAGLMVLGAGSHGDGAQLMGGLTGVLSLVALLAVIHLGVGNGRGMPLLPWQAMGAPTAVLAFFSLAAQLGWMGVGAPNSVSALAPCVLAAISVVAISYLSSTELRIALRR
jgi:putative peptidoglycan lipid II flippase